MFCWLAQYLIFYHVAANLLGTFATWLSHCPHWVCFIEVTNAWSHFCLQTYIQLIPFTTCPFPPQTLILFQFDLDRWTYLCYYSVIFFNNNGILYLYGLVDGRHTDLTCCSLYFRKSISNHFSLHPSGSVFLFVRFVFLYIL